MTPLMNPAAIHGCIQDLLLEQGTYDPLELLVLAGTLSYQDCTAWRRGERAAVEAVLDVQADDMADLLDVAADWAERIGLVGDPRRGPVPDERARPRSAHDRLNAHLGTSYHWPEERAQLDLFADSAGNVAIGALADALLARDAVAAERALARLEEGATPYRHVGHARLLVDALASTSPACPDDAAALLGRIETHWLPAANAVLGVRSGDFLNPFWRAAAAGLEDRGFDPAEPRAHASWPFWRCADWQGVRRSVLSVAENREHPVLVARLADAEWRLGARLTAVELWFGLCWEAPRVFESLVTGRAFPDSAIRRAWSRAREQDLEPEISPEWFPAWMLLEERGLARVLPARQGEGDAIRAYNAVRGLVGEPDSETANPIVWRQTLQAAHPGLLALYLARQR